MSLARAFQKFTQTDHRDLVAPAIALAITLFALRVMFRRLFLGVELTDEAFSTALAYRFALGDRPFIDEINSAQTAGMLFAPFVWLYLKIVKSSAGIMLFSRLCFFAFKLVVGGTVFQIIRRHLTWPLALVTSMIAVVFVPHSIANVGYNVLGSGFFALGTFLAARRFDTGGHTRHVVLAGICQGLATTAYPPLLVPVVMLGFILLAVAKDDKRRVFVAYVAGGLAVAAFVVPILWAAGREAINTSIEYGTKLTPRPNVKMFELVLGFWAHSPVSGWVVPAIVITLAALKLRPAWSVWALPLLVAGLSLAFPPSITGQMAIICYGALFAPIFLVLIGDDPFCRTLFQTVWIPSVVAGLITAFSSGNGEPNGAIGFFPAGILFIVYEAIAVQRLAALAHADDPRAAQSPLLMLGPAVMLLSMVAHFAFTVYRDSGVEELTVRMRTGPFRGLYTTKDRAAQMDELEAAIRRHENPKGRFLTYWNFPAGYLYPRMRPSSNTVWPVPVQDQPALAEYYRTHANGLGFVVLDANVKTNMPIDALVAKGKVLETTPHYLFIGDPP